MLTKKIIFWHQDFFTFSLANSLQKKINGEFYAVFDVTDRQKPFFQKQKLFCKAIYHEETFELLQILHFFLFGCFLYKASICCPFFNSIVIFEYVSTEPIP